MSNRRFKISRYVNFLDKADITIAYAFYQFLVFKSISHDLLTSVRSSIKNGAPVSSDVPDDFLLYLREKRIIEEDDCNG